MCPTILAALLTAVLSPDEAAAGNDVKTILATIESLQEPVKDFRCEFECTMRFAGDGGFRQQVDRNGRFSGTFIRKANGDIYSDVLKRLAVDNTIARETRVLRPAQHHAEEFFRRNDASQAFSVIKNPKSPRVVLPEFCALVFLLDALKREARDETKELSVEDGQLGGRALKVVNVRFKGLPDFLLGRFWIDLERSGHVVRTENYVRGADGKSALASHCDIGLAHFSVGASKVWMPVWGEFFSYYGPLDQKRRPIMAEEPRAFKEIKVVDGSMVFNTSPGPNVFTVVYKPGQPVSDQLRQLTTEFSQPKVDARASRRPGGKATQSKD